VVDTSNRDYQEKQMYNNKKRAMISKFKKSLSIGVEGSDDSGSDDSVLNEELRILSAAQMVPEIKPGFDVICNSVDDDRELEILLLDAEKKRSDTQ